MIGLSADASHSTWSPPYLQWLAELVSSAVPRPDHVRRVDLLLWKMPVAQRLPVVPGCTLHSSSYVKLNENLDKLNSVPFPRVCSERSNQIDNLLLRWEIHSSFFQRSLQTIEKSRKALRRSKEQFLANLADRWRHTGSNDYPPYHLLNNPPATPWESGRRSGEQPSCAILSTRNASTPCRDGAIIVSRTQALPHGLAAPLRSNIHGQFDTKMIGAAPQKQAGRTDFFSSPWDCAPDPKEKSR